jgi:hypothetical protein
VLFLDELTEFHPEPRGGTRELAERTAEWKGRVPCCPALPNPLGGRGHRALRRRDIHMTRRTSPTIKTVGMATSLLTYAGSPTPGRCGDGLPGLAGVGPGSVIPRPFPAIGYALRLRRQNAHQGFLAFEALFTA